MRKNKVPSPDFSATWQEAGDRLADSGNRLLLIGALVILLPSILPYVMISTVRDILILLLYAHAPTSGALPISLPCTLLLLAYTLFFVLPLIVGFFRMCHRTARMERVALADLFASFGSGARYRRDLSLSFDLFWRGWLLIAIASATCHVTVTLLGDRFLTGLLCVLAVLAEVAVGLCLILRRFSTWAVAIDQDVRRADATRKAKKIARSTRSSGIRFLWRMIPRILLGILTFGIFLIWEVLPRMCVAYFLYCNNLSENIDHQSEEYKNE